MLNTDTLINETTTFLDSFSRFHSGLESRYDSYTPPNELKITKKGWRFIADKINDPSKKKFNKVMDRVKDIMLLKAFAASYNKKKTSPNKNQNSAAEIIPVTDYESSPQKKKRIRKLQPHIRRIH